MEVKHLHTMLIHPSFPGQFGNLACALAKRPGDKVTFMTSVIPPPREIPFDVITYTIDGKQPPEVFRGGNDLQDHLDHARNVFNTCVSIKDLRPDVVVGHGSYGTWVNIRALYNARFIAYYEMIPPAPWSDAFIFRPDFPPTDGCRAFNTVYHALDYMHLEYCHAAYTPTRFQWSTVPEQYKSRVSVVHDGIDMKFFSRQKLPRPLTYHGVTIGPDTLVITYLSRGLESFRGFDIFMKAMKVVCQFRPNVVVLVVGADKTTYGHDLYYTNGMTFKQWVLSRDDYPLDRIRFLGTILPSELPTFFSLSDVHVYLTVPWVLSWSAVQAMACGCCMVVSDTPPLHEAIQHGLNGAMVPFMDHECLANECLNLLDDTELRRMYGDAARYHAECTYSLEHCIPQIIDVLEGK